MTAWIVAGGTTIRDAQELLGHADPRLLLGGCARATAEGKRTAVERLTRDAPMPQRAV